MSDSRQERIGWLDYVRVAACFMVIVVHASEQYYGVGDGAMGGPQLMFTTEAARWSVSIYDGLCRIAVPLFMMVSAYLLAPMPEGQTMGRFYKRRFRRVVPPMVCWLVLYSVLPLLWGGTTREAALHDLTHIPLNFPEMAGHLWFLYPLLGLYLFIPFISPWLRQASAKEERVFIGLFMVSTCIPFLHRLWGDVWGECFWNHYHMLYNFCGYLGYLVLAHYVRFHIHWSRRRRLTVGSVCLAVGSVVTVLSFGLQATTGVTHSTPEVELGWAFCTLNCVCATFGAFLLFSCIRQTKAPKLITETAKLSFGMYLMHIFWLGLWASVLTPLMEPYYSIPAMAVATFLSSLIATKLISLIPGSKWLIG